MKIAKQTTTDGKITGYMMRLSAVETGNWARKPGAAWPCSTLKDRRLWVAVDANGLYDYTHGGHCHGTDGVDGTELEACVSDHLPADCRHLWPTWQK